jgi:signal transduction histidine kinase
MSTSAEVVRASPQTRPTTRDGRPFLWLISLLCFGLMAAYAAANLKTLRLSMWETALWVPAIVAINMLPVTAWKYTPFIADLPLTVLASLVLSPAQVGLVILVAGFDPRELQRQITPTRAWFNRTQVAFAAFLASLACHGISGAPDESQYVVAIATLAMAVYIIGNYTLVGIGISLDRGYPFTHVMRRMLVGAPFDYAITLSFTAISAGAPAVLYGHSQLLAVLAAFAVSLLSRQTLARSQMAGDTGRAYRSREQALKQLSQQIHEERSDERRLIAAELHDEVLQPLFKVTLMAQVLKGDLAGGRLLELDQDLPELLTAAELASTTLRELIGDLRRSALGRGGLGPALTRFVGSTSERAACRVHVDIQQVVVDADAELVIYQIAKEALANAFTHSKAKNVWLTLRDSTQGVELAVQDDGIGFDPETVPSGHFGIEIMRERATAIGAGFWVDASLGAGTRILVAVGALRDA